jgi:hypothetical protein
MSICIPSDLNEETRSITLLQINVLGGGSLLILIKEIT